ncbi:MBOAT family protein [Nannocystis bainbridge]|uniref:MBOAT family protein n=1 Tax=Nannocystis bainbridge TaxID=2995303 RepID=A0ABT5EC84_9BACT|nr:MBOAT family protein [Nannocystis bainbridge]MDC0723462.1 MBOAT family protein [Nannocystis bainbridge]
MPIAVDVALAVTGAALSGVLAVGFVLPRLRDRAAARALAWTNVLTGLVAVLLACVAAPAGFRMFAICGVVLFAMKGVVAVEERHAHDRRLDPLAWIGWAAAWPGMRPDLFAALPWRPLPGAGALLRKGAIRLGVGVLCLLAARLVFPRSELLAAALALPGLSLVLHFGLFNLLAGAWRLVGVPAYSLFDHPLAARGLSEFWGRRWNLPFTEMTQRAVYRPLLPALGRDRAAVLAFAFSGLLHEVAISLPVRAGFGGPMLYFLLHGGATRLEPRLRPAFARRPWLAHAWTVGWLVLPMPLLFHPPFLRGVVWPLLGLA